MEAESAATGHYVIDVLIGPCSRDEAEAFLDELASADTGDVDAVFALRPVKEGEFDFDAT